MADTLQEALAGLRVTPEESGYGVAASALGAVTPQLINPYASTGQAVGIGLGSILLQSLLGYQARQSALQDSLQANTLANQMLQMQTPEARTEFIKTSDTGPVIGSRLATLSTALTQQEMARKAKAAEKLLDLETAADFELGPKGTELFQRKIESEAQRQAAITGAFTQRQQIEDELLRGRALQRRQLGLEDVNVPAAIMNRAIEKNASSDLAIDVASTIDNYKSIPEFAAAKSISAFGDDQLKSRLRNLATIVLQSRSGLAATDKERENLQKILLGDFTAVAPETVSNILKRFAQDEKSIAADTVAAATQRPEAFVGELRQALEEGRKTSFAARTPQYGQPSVAPTQPSNEARRKEQLMKEIADMRAAISQMKKEK